MTEKKKIPDITKEEFLLKSPEWVMEQDYIKVVNTLQENEHPVESFISVFCKTLKGWRHEYRGASGRFYGYWEFLLGHPKGVATVYVKSIREKGGKNG